MQRDLSSLPRTNGGQGVPPDEGIRFADALIQKWMEEDEPKPTAADTRMRFSDAGKCARLLSFKAAGIPASNPMDAAGHHATGLGTILHDKWEAALQARYPDAEVEVTGVLTDVDSSGDADILVRVDGRLILLDMKTTGGYGFKMMVGERGVAEGPRRASLYQLALNARAHDVDEAVICLMATEAISKNAAAKKGFSELGRFLAEWTYQREELEPLADREVRRQNEILRLLDEEKKLAPRHIPDEMPMKSRIVDPQKGRWELRDGQKIIDTGSTWMCGYCSHQTICASVGPDSTTIASRKE